VLTHCGDWACWLLPAHRPRGEQRERSSQQRLGVAQSSRLVSLPEHTLPMVGKLVAIFALGLMGIGCSGGDECPDGRTKQRICVECGPAGGCAKRAEECVQSCATHADCEHVGQGFVCEGGICQVRLCI
jgi:hypothetical protein